MTPTGSIDTASPKAFLASYKHLTRRYLHASVGLGLSAGLLLIVQAWCLAHIVSSVIFEQQTLGDLWPWMAAMLFLFIIRAALTWLSEQAAFKASAQIKLTLRNQLHQHLFNLGPAYIAKQRSGELVNSLVDGVEALEDYYAKYLPSMSLVVLVPLAILAFIFPFDWLSGLILVLTAPFIPFFMILIGKGTEKLNQKQWRKLSRMSAHFLDMIQGLTTLKLFNTSRHEAGVIARISEEYRRSTMSVLRVAFLSSMLLEFLATVSIALVAVLIGFRLFYGEIDFFYGFFILLLAPEFYLPLRNMGTHYHARMEAIGASEKIIDILETPLDEHRDSNNETLKTASSPHSFQANHKKTIAPSTLTESSGLSITFEHVTFAYEQDRPALNDLSLVIEANSTTALIGSSGCGKSSLIALLLTFYRANSGRILINDTPINSIPHQQWMQSIAWLPQTPHLFSGSIFSNIALGELSHTIHSASASQPNENPDSDVMQRVIHAAKQAYAHDFIMQLPDQYHTVMSENGMGLSGGQRQRIALARAFFKNAPLLMLDEATANLDKESEQLIVRALQEQQGKRTIIMSAHRLDSIQHADHIITLNQGQIANAPGDQASTRNPKP